MVAHERTALADTLDDLTENDADTPSLCRGWTVHNVAAHVVMVLEVTGPRFMKTLVRSRGSFDRANDLLTREWSRRSLPDLSDALRRHAESRFTPPGVGPEAPLADTLVHGLDVREPLGIERTVPPAPAAVALDFLADLTPVPGQPGPTLVPRRLLDGLRLQCDDLDWAHGRGRPVHGRAEDLLLAMTGRLAGARRLSGAGAPALVARLASSRR